MNSPIPSFGTMNSHQAIMKCPWQWRQPFLDEKRASRKRKVGDGYFYDPVDPSFVDHLLPGHAKKFCAELLESDEKEQIQLEIQRLMLQKEQRANRLIYDVLFFSGSSTTDNNDNNSNRHVRIERSSSSDDDNERSAAADSAHADERDANAMLLQPSTSDVNRENMALVDSILLMTKSVDESSLLASPKSVSSPLSPLLLLDDDSDDEEHYLVLGGNSSSSDSDSDDIDLTATPTRLFASSLELVSDNLQDDYFASADSDLLTFPTASD